ncbi:MAG TPA: hypothetical protein VN461_13345 [Vicinamibacteria bacterium]|nr:hypothetical protein [Vicinamibacteria bacterium]
MNGTSRAPTPNSRPARRLALALALGAAACSPSPSPPGPAAPLPTAALPCGTEVQGARNLAVLHRYWQQTSPPSTSAAGALDRDVNNVALLLDRGDLVVRRNPFDLDAASLRFAPNRGGGYDVVRLSLPLDSGGTPLSIVTGGSAAVGLPFPFPFFGTTFTQVFVNADGSLTFGAPDTGEGEQGLARFLAGPPRAAAFLADLDPSRGGTIAAQVLADRAVILWTGVPGGGQINHNTFEITLHAGGVLEMVYGEMQSREAVVGVSPGSTRDVTPADLSVGHPAGSTGALAERFSETEKLDLVSVSRRFFARHPDVFEQIVMYTTRPLNPVAGTLAFELNVRNDIQGIGLETGLDETGQWGSAGGLASVVFMDSIDQYLEVDGFEILGHEVGHRWLARVQFRDGRGSLSNALLGRGLVHWSFFMNSDASVLEGNRIADRGGGHFETVDITRGYSALDQYVMGMRLPEEVPPVFYVDEPDNFRPNRSFKFSSAPEAGISFTGTRRDVRIEDMIAALGPRVPDALHAPRLLRHAFILVADDVAPATADRLQALARIRSRFGPYYLEATGGRGAVDSTLP